MRFRRAAAAKIFDSGKNAPPILPKVALRSAGSFAATPRLRFGGVLAMAMRFSVRAAMCLYGLALASAPVGDPGRALAQAPAAARVGTVLAALEPINPSQDYVGRVEAIERVNVRARVTGYLDAVLFREGELVKEGAPLFKIESAPFEAAMKESQGALVKAQGQAGNATLALERAETLLKTQSGSAAMRDQRVAEEQTAKGDVLQAQANLETAKINLGYTEIKAPVAGVIGRAAVTKGNLVGPDAGVLTTIVSQDPIYVTAPVSQREFLKLDAEKRRSGAAALSVTLTFSDGSTYDQPGKINFIDNTVNRATDSVLVRASFPNPQGRLIDGQLVRVEAQGEKPEEKILIPQSALIADQQGVYVFVVEGGKAAVRRLKLGGESGPNSIVDSGLNVGDQVIVEGMEVLRPGAPVIGAPAAKPLGRS